MKYCQNCGNQIEDNIQFCPRCGAPQQQMPPNNQQGQFNYPQQNQYVVNTQAPKTEKKKTGCGTILLWIFFWPIMLWVHAFRKKQVGWFILAAIVTLLLFAAYGTSEKYGTWTQTSSSRSSYQSSSNSSPSSTKTPKPTPTPTLTPTPITYSSATARQLEDDLSQNAAKAKQVYEGNYYEVTGIIQTIDASGKYFSIRSESSWISDITFYVKNETQKQQLINNFSRDMKVTVKGKCTSVGELSGYIFDWQ